MKRKLLVLFLAGATEYSAGESIYEELARFVSPTIPTEEVMRPAEPPNLAEASVDESTTDSEPPSQELQVDFDGLHAVNLDIVAWLYYEGTAINYPSVQGKDNAFYLDRLFTGESNSSGCLFMGYNNKPDFSDRNTVIYGHNMNNGSMFADLLKCKSQAFYDAHPRMALVTPGDTYAVGLSAAYIAHTSEDS